MTIIILRFPTNFRDFIYGVGVTEIATAYGAFHSILHVTEGKIRGKQSALLSNS